MHESEQRASNTWIAEVRSYSCSGEDVKDKRHMDYDDLVGNESFYDCFSPSVNEA